MSRTLRGPILAVLFCLLAGADWPQFRGPDGTSVSRGVAPPVKWSATDNVAWTAELPGRGPASPIVVGGRVFVTCSGGGRQDRLDVLAFDVARGTELWRREFWATGRTLTHPFSAVAAPTPASDGQRIFAFFSSNDLVCLDLDGNLLWYRGLAYDWPKAGNDAGMGSSPVVTAETVVVQIENQGDSFAAGIDVASGETRWRVPRPPVASWCTPVAVSAGPQAAPGVLLQSASELIALDARTGSQRWRYEVPCAGIPSLVAANGRIFLPANGLTVLELDASGATPKLAWDSNRLSPGSSSPVVDGDRVYVVNGAGVLACADARNGKMLWQLRLGGNYWSTPVIVRDRMYCVNQDGAARVVQLGEAGAVIASSELGETILASPAVADGALFLRSDRHLWKIAAR